MVAATSFELLHLELATQVTPALPSLLRLLTIRHSDHPERRSGGGDVQARPHGV